MSAKKPVMIAAAAAVASLATGVSPVAAHRSACALHVTKPAVMPSRGYGTGPYIAGWAKCYGADVQASLQHYLKHQGWATVDVQENVNKAFAEEGDCKVRPRRWRTVGRADGQTKKSVPVTLSCP